MKIRQFSLVLIGLFLSIPSSAGLRLPSVKIRTYEPSPGVSLRYVIATPGGFGASLGKLPVWIFQSGDGTIARPFDPITAAAMSVIRSNRLQVVFVYPELRRDLYSKNLRKYCQLDYFHRIHDLDALIDLVKKIPLIDQNRIYLFGHSAGSEIATLTANARNDIAGVATFGGGTASWNERNGVPEWAGTAIQNHCDNPQTYRYRSGTFWSQLIFESNLFKEISRAKEPYLAMLGSGDLGDQQDAKFAEEIKKVKRNFQFTIIPGMKHDLGVSMKPWEQAERFFRENGRL